MELKEFEFKDEHWPKWPDRSAVLFVDGDHGPEDTYYVLNAQEGITGTAIVFPDKIDQWIEMLTWVKEHAERWAREHEAERAIEAGDAEPVIDPRTLDDSVGVTEEDG